MYDQATRLMKKQSSSSTYLGFLDVSVGEYMEIGKTFRIKKKPCKYEGNFKLCIFLRFEREI